MKSYGFLTMIVLTCSLAVSHAITLDEAIALGKQRSLKQQGPKIDRIKVDGQIEEAWSNALPQLEGNIAYQRAWKKSVMFFPNPETGKYTKLELEQNNASQAQAVLNQPIYTFGRVGAGLRAAYSARRANDHLTMNNGQQLELDIMKRYWSVQLLRDVVAVRRSGLQISDSALQKIKRLRDVGLRSDYDVLRAQVQANNQKPQLQQAENSLKLAEMAFRELLGVPLDSNLTVEGTLASSSASESLNASPEELRSKVASRSDLEALRDVEDVYHNGYTIYRNMSWPVIAAQVKYTWQWSNSIWAMNPMNNASSVAGALAIQIPLWTSGKNDGKAQQFKADWKKAQLDLRQAERGAMLQFESAIESHQTAIENEKAATTAVEQAETARKIAQTKLEQGLITPLEMDSAHLDEMVAKVALAQAKFDRLVASADAKLAAGLSPHGK